MDAHGALQGLISGDGAWAARRATRLETVKVLLATPKSSGSSVGFAQGNATMGVGKALIVGLRYR